MGLYNETSTSTSLGNTGQQKFPGSKGKVKHLVLVPTGTEIATKVLALTKATWTNSLNAAIADRWFLTPEIFNNNPTQEEPKRNESDYGKIELVQDGKATYMIDFVNQHTHNKNELFKLNNGSFSAYILTEKNKFRGYTTDGVKFLPFTFDYHRVLPETEPSGTALEHVQFECRFADVTQLNELEVVLDPVYDTDAPANWYPCIELPLYAVKDLIIEVSGMTATGCTIDLHGYDGVAYSAAVKEDLYMRKSTVDGVAITITSLTPSATVEGRYTAVFGAQTSGTFYFSLYDQGTAPGTLTAGVETPVYDTVAFSVS